MKGWIEQEMDVRTWNNGMLTYFSGQTTKDRWVCQEQLPFSDSLIFVTTSKPHIFCRPLPGWIPSWQSWHTDALHTGVYTEFEK